MNRFLSIATLVLGLFVCPLLVAQDEYTNDDVSVGFENQVRLGLWSAISFDTESLTVKPRQYEIACLDGDGSPVKFQGRLTLDNSFPNIAQAVFRPGRASGNIDVVLLSNSGERVGETSIAHGEGFEGFPSTSNLFLFVGQDAEFTEFLREMAANLKPAPIVRQSPIDGSLPAMGRGYQSVDQLFLSTRDIQGWESLGNKRVQAIVEWVEQGGHLIVSAGQGSGKLFEAEGILNAFCPGNFVGEVDLEKLGRLKAFANSKNDLIGGNGQFSIANVKSPTGLVRLSDGKNPLIIEQAIGLGRLTFVAADLLADEFKRWDGTQSLIRKAIFGSHEESEFVKQSGSRVSHFGYEDLIGQLRVPLDQFSNVRFVTFTWVAILIALFILCIGPGDYFLLRKVFKKMELTWLTFGLITAAFCGLAWFTAKSTKPSVIQINQLEIIDMDSISGQTRGKIWANLFSPKTQQLAIDIEETNDLGFHTNASEVTWQGLPGNGLGGMGSISTSAITGEEYQIEIGGDESNRIRIADFPMRVSSTKPVYATWTASNPVKANSRLQYTARNNRNKKLEGTLTNPFDQQLSNCRVIFEDWVYILDRPLDSGETVDIITETREKNARSYFGRKSNVDDKGGNQIWDPTDTRISRIAEMLMFYDSAGGKTYTGLTHDYQSDVDLSHLVHLNRAILIGELGQHTTDVLIDGEAPKSGYDQQFTILRIILPVQKKK